MKKLVQHRLRWFGHVQRRPPEAPVRSGILSQDSNVKRGRGRLKLTWVESIKGDLKGWNILKDLALDRSAWKIAIHVPGPWLLLLSFNSSLLQLVWDLKALLLLLYWYPLWWSRLGAMLFHEKNSSNLCGGKLWRINMLIMCPPMYGRAWQCQSERYSLRGLVHNIILR